VRHARARNVDPPGQPAWHAAFEEGHGTVATDLRQHRQPPWTRPWLVASPTPLGAPGRPGRDGDPRGAGGAARGGRGAAGVAGAGACVGSGRAVVGGLASCCVGVRDRLVEATRGWQRVVVWRPARALGAPRAWCAAHRRKRARRGSAGAACLRLRPWRGWACRPRPHRVKQAHPSRDRRALEVGPSTATSSRQTGPPLAPPRRRRSPQDAQSTTPPDTNTNNNTRRQPTVASTTPVPHSHAARCQSPATAHPRGAAVARPPPARAAAAEAARLPRRCVRCGRRPGRTRPARSRSGRPRRRGARRSRPGSRARGTAGCR
jgi:hypothetical protein